MKVLWLGLGFIVFVVALVTLGGNLVTALLIMGGYLTLTGPAAKKRPARLLPPRS